MIELTPKFVTPSEFLNYWGIDLNARLRDDDEPSNKAERFLCRVERRLMNWIDANTYRNIAFEDLNGKQLEAWQLSILTQAMYIFKNSDIGLDSGYDPEHGIVAQKAQLEEIEICRQALDYIKEAGLYNQVIDNRFRYLRY